MARNVAVISTGDGLTADVNAGAEGQDDDPTWLKEEGVSHMTSRNSLAASDYDISESSHMPREYAS